jgi:hypothetical protein
MTTIKFSAPPESWVEATSGEFPGSTRMVQSAETASTSKRLIRKAPQKDCGNELHTQNFNMMF